MTRFLLFQDDLVISQQLTLIEIEIFQRIDISELIGLHWTKPKFRSLSQNVHFLIERVNQLTFWTATCILMQSTLKKQSQSSDKIHHNCKALERLKQFQWTYGNSHWIGVKSCTKNKTFME